MGQNTIDKILESRRQTAAATGTAPAFAVAEENKFYSILVGEVMQEHFLEFRFKLGLRTCFAYSDLAWFNYDPESGSLDLVFGEFLVTVKGRGLGEKIFDGIRQKRLAWIKEADSELEDHQGNEVFVQEITVTPPSAGNEEEPAAA
jgi:hypothetical protein